AKLRFKYNLKSCHFHHCNQKMGKLTFAQRSVALHLQGLSVGMSAGGFSVHKDTPLQDECDDMGETGDCRPDLKDRLEYMSDLISQLELMAREQGLTKLAALLQQAHAEAGRRRNGKDH